MEKADYVHQGNQDLPESERLHKLEELFDPRTKDLLQKIGIRDGISFLEAGPGRGGLLEWLLERVGALGKVTAVDINTRFINHIKHPNFFVEKGDLVEIGLGTERYDIIHERFVLTHISKYEAVLKKMTAALKPGGWILLEDSDFSAAHIETSDESLARGFAHTIEARRQLFAEKDVDYSFGRKLPELLAKFGFEDIRKDVFSPLEKGGSGLAEIQRLSTLQLWDQYLGTGVASEDDLRTYIRVAGDPDKEAKYFSTISAWGRKPMD